MKKQLSTALMLMLFVLSANVFGAGKNITVQVNGMVCAFCSQGITKNFKAHPSIQDVKVDMTKKEVSLSLKEDKDISNEEITTLIVDSGVSVDKIVR